MKKKLGLLFLALSMQLVAQEKKKDTIGLNQVVIEVNKTQTELQNLPASVTHLGFKELNGLQINKTADLNSFVPNFFMPEYGSKLTSPVYIRGIGSRINEPSVGLYVDDIPYFDKGTYNFQLFDVQKIEVLRGPQGTLYGRNTMGGLIRVFTKQPEQTTGLKLNLGYGSYNQQKAGVHFNTALTPKISFLIDGIYNYKSGFFTNTFDQSPADENKTYATRAKLLFKPNKNTSLLVSTSYDNDHQNGYPYAVYDTQNQRVEAVDYDQPSGYNQDLFSLGINGKYSSKKVNYKLTASYQKMKDLQNVDQDFTSNNIYYVSQNRDNNYYVGEFNAYSKKSSKIQWIGGVFTFKSGKYKEVSVDVNTAHMNLYKTYNQPTSGIATFGEATLPLAKLKFTAGLRYDHEQTGLKYVYDLSRAGTTSNKADLDLKLSYDELLPKFSVNYMPNSNINAYAVFTKGYKAGGFNSTIERKQDESYKPEYDYNYELGLKTQWLNNKLTANADVFYIDWKDQQIYQTVPSGRGVMLKNAGKSYSKGVELELAYNVSKKFNFMMSYGRTEAKFVEYKKDEMTDYAGNYIPFVPQCNAGIAANYNLFFDNHNLRKISFNVNVKRTGKLYWDETNKYYQDPYNILNASVTAKFKKISISLWGKNLLNETYFNHFFTISTLHKSYVQQSAPIQFGISATYKLM